MSDTASQSRVEPSIGAAPEARATTPPPPPAAIEPAPVAAAQPAARLDQLSRIEDKTARVEEKFARIENLLHRVEAAALNLEDVARRTDMEKLSGRVGRLPRFPALVAFAVVTAVLTAAITIAIIRYAPGIVAR